MRLVFRSAIGVAIISLGFAASASASPDPWRDAAARVNYPLYQPTVTLGFKLKNVEVQGCGDSGNTTVQALYQKGSGTKAPLFGFDEAYPQFCGNPGESMTVRTVDVNGAKVPVQVFCYGGSGCTVADGITNGFLMYLRLPGSKRTPIAVTSRYVALDDLLKVARSLTRVVAKPKGAPIASPPTSTTPGVVAGRCSKATAAKVATRLHVGVDPVLGKTPIFGVLCGPFLGQGSQAMVAEVAAPIGCGGPIEWAVFRFVGGAWRLVMKRPNGAFLSKVGSSDIRERVGAPRPGDPRCSPSAWKTRTWHWNGSRLVAGPWQVTSGTSTAAAGASKSGYFKTPSGNIVCGHGYGGKDSRRYVACRIKSGLQASAASGALRASRGTRLGWARRAARRTGPSICPGEARATPACSSGGAWRGYSATARPGAAAVSAARRRSRG